STAVALLRVCLGKVAKSGRPTCSYGRPIGPVVAWPTGGCLNDETAERPEPAFVMGADNRRSPWPCGLPKIINADVSPGFAARHWRWERAWLRWPWPWRAVQE